MNVGLLCCGVIVDSGIIVDRLGKSASESFQTGLDRRESGAIPRVSSSPLCQYVILHGEQVNTVIGAQRKHREMVVRTSPAG